MTSFPEHLTDEERSRINVNHCVRESELTAARDLCAAAEPGEWRVKVITAGGGEGFFLTRYSGDPIMKRASFDFAAKARSIVPRLLGGIAALERALRYAWIGEATAKRELRAERDAHAATMKRQSEGKTGPEHELEMLAEYVTLWAAGNVGLTGEMPEEHKTRHLASYTRYLLLRWAGGASIARELSPDTMARAQREVDERAKFRAEEDAKTEELRRQLREAIEKVARGEIPEALKPALREAKKRAKAKGRSAP